MIQCLLKLSLIRLQVDLVKIERMERPELSFCIKFQGFSTFVLEHSQIDFKIRLGREMRLEKSRNVSMSLFFLIIFL